MEWIDIVDETNCIVGCGTRDFIHRNQLRHRASHVLLFNQQGELLLQQRALEKEVFPGLWDSSAAGHAAVREDALSCIIRECQEELGLRPNSIDYLVHISATAENGWEFMSVFLAVTDQEVSNYCREEIIALRWLAWSEVHRLIMEDPAMFTPTFLKISDFVNSSHAQTIDGNNVFGL